MENNSPQLVVMGVVMGAALLILGEAGEMLNQFFNHVNDWVGTTVRSSTG